MASSSDGTKLLAAQWFDASNGPGQLYTSTNSGMSWKVTSTPTASWMAVASASDGAKLLAAQYTEFGPGQLYISTDSGGQWTSP